MFLLQAPQVREFDVFTILPEHFRRRALRDQPLATSWFAISSSAFTRAE